MPRRGLPRGLVALGAAAALLFVGSLAAVLVMAPWRGTSPPGEDPTGAYRSADPAEPDANLDGLTLLPFTMADQLGRPVTQDIFLGKVTIMDFGFTRCPLVCPIMRSRMADLRDRLRDVPVQFVTISIDPEHDTPEVLRAYAAEVEADPERWRFLTGDKATAWRLVREGLL
ncbi:MAG TPA: SCO family protein, partial [Phycisphaerales bacterium]|nr:SCO family protein [Phycisphaerales bacterium]